MPAPRYRIIYDPNDLDYRRYTAQYRVWFGWRYFRHQCHGLLGDPRPNEWVVSHFGTLEEALARIRKDWADRKFVPLPVKVTEVQP